MASCGRGLAAFEGGFRQTFHSHKPSQTQNEEGALSLFMVLSLSLETLDQSGEYYNSYHLLPSLDIMASKQPLSSASLSKARDLGCLYSHNIHSTGDDYYLASPESGSIPYSSKFSRSKTSMIQPAQLLTDNTS